MARPLTLVAASPAVELTQERLRLAAAARAPNTVLGYATDWKYFAAWCAERGVASLPASAETVALYITDRLNRGYRVSSVRRFASSIRHHHAAAGLEGPPRAVTSTLLAGAQRIRGEQPEQKAPLTVEQVRAIVGTLRGKKPETVRNRATLRRYYRPEDPFRGNPVAALGL